MYCLALAPREPQLGPRDLAGFDHRADLAFARRQRRAARLHLEKYDPPHLTRREPVEHDEVDRTAKKTRVLGIEPEFGEIGNELLVHLAGRDGQAALDGIFLLAGVGAYLLFSSGPAGPPAAVLYGIGLGLTFDEFGMWLHLNGDYWQRASFDAIVVLAAALGLAGFAPPIRPWRPRLLAALLLIFVLVLAGSFRLAARAEPQLQRWEQRVRS